MTRIVPFGEAAILVVLGDRIDVDLNRRVHALAAAVRSERAGLPWLGEPVPGYASLLVPFDPLATDTAEVTAVLQPMSAAVAATAHTEEEPADVPAIDLPTRYGGPDGPDLDEVARLHGLRPEDVVELHASVAYRVFLVGFAPGFAYLGPVPAAIATPRHATPRERVPAGSVGIAGEQTGVYPFASPGGWQLIGRTNATVWDVRRDPPALLRPGARVRFVPVGR